MLKINEFKRRFYIHWRAPTEQTVSEWADTNRVLSSESSAEPGRWRTDRAPYQREIMDAVTLPEVEKVIVMSSAQVGKSEMINNIAGRYIDKDPCSMLLVQPTISMAEDYSKRRIAPLIRDTETLRGKVADTKTRDLNNTIMMKVFPGGMISLAGANSAAGLASRPIRLLFCDEVDRYPDSAGTEGDPVLLAEKRQITFWNKKRVYTSTPGIKGVSRIEPEYLSGSQEEWQIECPHCGKYVFINLYGMIHKEERDAKGNYSVLSVVFRCPHCLVEHDELTWKAQPGYWISQNPEVKNIRSFKLNAFVSPWLAWNEIILDYLHSKDDPDLLKVFTNTMLGETYEVKGEIENEEFLMRRREAYDADLPDGVLLLTAAVDTQDRWLEYEIVGWGKDEESWAISHGIVMGSPGDAETWHGIDDVLKSTYHFASGAGQTGLTVACACIDSGGHFTTSVYEYCKINERRRFFAIKGQGGAGIPLVYRITRTKKENAALIILGVDEGKTAVIDSLKIKTPGKLFCHFPKDAERGYDSVYFKGIISERQVPRKVKGRVVLNWEKVSTDARNEPFDLRNYARAAMKMLSPNFEKLEISLNRRKGQDTAPQAGPIQPQKPVQRVIKNDLGGE